MGEERTTIFDDPKISVWYYPELGIIHHQIHTYCYGDPFRNALSAGVDAMLEHGATRWLSDDRENGPLSPEDEQWATQTWFPRVKAAGWKHWAMVQPHRVIGQMNVARFVAMYREQGITARIFSDPDEAFAWLRDPGDD